jgi:hypothetical protein
MVRYLVFIPTDKKAGFVCGSMSCIVLRGNFYGTVVLSLHLQTVDKCDDSKVQFLYGIRVSIWSLSLLTYENSVRFLMQNWKRSLSQLGMRAYVKIVMIVVLE